MNRIILFIALALSSCSSSPVHADDDGEHGHKRDCPACPVCPPAPAPSVTPVPATGASVSARCSTCHGWSNSRIVSMQRWGVPRSHHGEMFTASDRAALIAYLSGAITAPLPKPTPKPTVTPTPTVTPKPIPTMTASPTPTPTSGPSGAAVLARCSQCHELNAGYLNTIKGWGLPRVHHGETLTAADRAALLAK